MKFVKTALLKLLCAFGVLAVDVSQSEIEKAVGGGGSNKVTFSVSYANNQKLGLPTREPTATPSTSPTLEPTVPPTTAMPTVSKNWIVSKNGATCDQTCGPLGKSCNADKQTKVNTWEKFRIIIESLGHTCNHVHQDLRRDYAGTPFFGLEDTCVYFTTNGGSSVCNGNKFGHHNPLCYCEVSKNWIVSKNGATCDQTCGPLGKSCNADEQRKVNTWQKLRVIMESLGHTCNPIHQDVRRDYAGTPFFGPEDTCVYFTTNGGSSVCNGNQYGHHNPLCYCE